MFLKSGVVLLALILVCSAQRQYRRRPVSPKQGGVCPPTPDIDVCDMTCYDDGQCPGAQRCCRTACHGTYCVEPVTGGQEQRKKGDCPAPSGPWVCSSRCSRDSDCRGEKKCCKNRCGAMACVQAAGILDESYYSLY